MAAMVHGNNGRIGFVMESKDQENTYRLALRCPKCGLMQYVKKECRRCKKPIPFPDVLPDVFLVKICTRVVREKIERSCLKCGLFNDELLSLTEYDIDEIPTMHDMRKDLILRAMNRCNQDVRSAAKLLGIGKTTMYRHLIEMGFSKKR